MKTDSKEESTNIGNIQFKPIEEEIIAEKKGKNSNNQTKIGILREIESDKEVIQEQDQTMEKKEQSLNILPAESAQWSNVTIRKKEKKKSYKF